MIIVLNIFCALLSIYIAKTTFSRRSSALYICLVVFDLLYVVPLIVELILGNARTPYPGIINAQNDIATSFLYAGFIICVQIVFFIFLKKRSGHKYSFSFKENFENTRLTISKNGIIAIISAIACIVPIFAIIFAPQPADYLTHIGAFAMNTVMVTAEELNYHKNIAQICKYIGFIGVIFLKLYDRQNQIFWKILRSLSIISITLIDGKRTFITFLILMLLFVDFMSDTKKIRIIRRVVNALAIVAIYFVLYSYLTGKYEYNTNWYSVISEYFFRSNSVRVTLYAQLHPDKLKILDYPFQSFIYDLLYFIPKNIWTFKPAAFPQYYSTAVLGIVNTTEIDWFFQTNWYTECIANIGFLGILVGPLFIVYLSKIVDRSKNIVTHMIGLFFTVMITVFEYSDMFKIVFLVWILMIIRDYSKNIHMQKDNLLENKIK
ncbi:hypothetical protein A4W83_07705 [Latilactobacillus sakei]|nr:hypothetical protein A4W83_07705 [Latilactobacillus sakei]USG12107.1 hypothetical protein A4W85_07695 [Latilactobacillus sakei]